MLDIALDVTLLSMRRCSLCDAALYAILQVFFTLSVEDLKEIGITTFGPRRKMINAIESWQKEHGPPPVLTSGTESNQQLATLVKQMQSELKEKTWQLNQVLRS